jgi:hypothetical protein
MSENLNLLRQKYCRPGSFTGKRTDHLFPLEEECEEGKALLATAPKTLLHLQEFDPYGLQQTYRDEASGAELPLSSISREAISWLLKSRRIRSPQSTSPKDFRRTFRFKSPKHS